MRRQRRQSGAALLETAMVTPILLLLLLGMTELARVGYTYYTLQKIMFTLARYVGTQQGVDFCDASDATVQAAKNLAITGTPDGSGTALVRGLSADLINVRVERYSAVNQNLGECDCSATGCDTAQGSLTPDFIVVDMPNGYTVQPVFPQLVVQPFVLRPSVRVPYAGT
jgi:Flp pilus assembly protein TadG